MGHCFLSKAGFHPVGNFVARDILLLMRTKLLIKSTEKLDDKNARHVGAALKWLDEGNVTEACGEIRKIQRMFAGHPAVIKVRQRLVSVLCGWDETGTTAEPQCV